ncbi:MAG: extracellular solute-binding protein [Ruminococcaceae bacterium]|nr:extracellular solute-binding protein [Oscillospiraceae bacterium]
MKKFFKNILAMTLAAAMTLPLAACSEGGAGSGSGGGNSGGGTSGSGNNGSNDSAKQDKIVVWTLANDLKQFAERYTNETGNEVEVIVYDSADFKTKINQTLGTKSSDLDVFVGEPQMLPDFFEAGFSADLSCFDEQVKTRLADYTYQAGCDSDGVLRAISYQSCPGSVIYRRDIAEKVFGTDDPDEIGKLFASFGAIEETAKKLQESGYTIFGDTGALRWFSNSSSPWVKDNEIIVDQDRLDYFDCAVELYQKEYVAFAPEWSAAWYASMAGPLPMHAEWSALDEVSGNAQTEVFSYVMPAWGALIVRDNAKDNNGKLGICSGVCSFFGGGTFLTVNEYSKHKDAAKQFIEYCTLNDDTARWWIGASKGDMIANKAVLEENRDYKNEAFGNQNTYGFFLEELDKIDYSLITGYDDACKDAFGAAIISVQKGEKTKEAALDEFYKVVITQYPELKRPA